MRFARIRAARGLVALVSGSCGIFTVAGATYSTPAVSAEQVDHQWRISFGEDATTSNGKPGQPWFTQSKARGRSVLRPQLPRPRRSS